MALRIEVTQGGNQTLLYYPVIVSLKDRIHASMTLYMVALHCKFALVFQISTAHGGVLLLEEAHKIQSLKTMIERESFLLPFSFALTTQITPLYNTPPSDREHVPLFYICYMGS